MNNRAVRILLVDDHELVRYGLGRMLEQEEDMQVVGGYATAEDIFPWLGELLPDIILMDIHVPGMNGIEATRHLKGSELSCNADVIILADTGDYRAEALEAGAADYLLRDATCAELTETIREVYWSKYPPGEGKDFTREAVELVIPAPPQAEAAQLLRFLCQLEEILNDNYNSIMRVVGSWDEGATIALTLQPNTLAGLLGKLANMPNIKTIKEEPLVKRTISNLANKFGVLLKLGTNPSRRIRITLRKTEMARRGLATTLN